MLELDGGMRRGGAQASLSGLAEGENGESSTMASALA